MENYLENLEREEYDMGFCQLFYGEDSSETELIRAGIVPEKLEYMRGEERRKILLEAGLEPMAFDF